MESRKARLRWLEYAENDVRELKMKKRRLKANHIEERTSNLIHSGPSH
jgi:hypothetical protein